MKYNRIIRNPYLFFSPFLIIFLAIVLIFQSDGIAGDQHRYITYAKNLLNGFYSPQPPDVDLGNGPGYPIFLMLFVALKLPNVIIMAMNAVLFYISIILIFKTLQYFVSNRIALIFSLFWACYINHYEYLPLIQCETLTVSLVSSIIFILAKTFKQDNVTVINKFTFLSGLLIGFLVLTKPIFGYVLLFILLVNGLLWLFSRTKGNYRSTFIILFIALLLNIPYLFYTYKLTGKMFLWSSFGGDNLYWMSTPYKNEYGSWIYFNSLENDSNYYKDFIPGAQASLKSNHQNVWDEISSLKGVEKDDALKRIAIENIKSHPIKFLQNCLSNVGRIVFNVPYSYKAQKNSTLLRIPFNGIIILLSLFCLLPTYLNWREIPYTIRFILFFALIYLCGSVLGSAETRMFTVIVPILLLWIAYIIQRTIVINLKFMERVT